MFMKYQFFYYFLACLHFSLSIFQSKMHVVQVHFDQFNLKFNVLCYRSLGVCNDPNVRERSLESAATEFRRRFHISVDDVDANRRDINVSIHQVKCTFVTSK